MRPYNRNVYLAIFLLFLGGLLLIIGLSLYLRGNPEDSGEDTLVSQIRVKIHMLARDHSTGSRTTTTAHPDAQSSADLVLGIIQG